MSVLVLLAAVGGFAGPAAANDDFEPNDGFDEATSVSPGEYEDLRIDGGESDVFAIELDAGETLVSEIGFSHAEGDLDLVVYGPDRRAIDGSASVTDDEQVELTVQESGTYYVVVEGYGGASADYDLSLSVREGSDSGTSSLEQDRFEPNDNVDEAAPVEEGVHSELTVESGDSDFFAVELEAGQRATVDVYFDHSAVDIDLAVYGPDEYPVADSRSMTDDERATFTAQSAGTYYVVVEGYSGASGEYDLELSFEDPPEPDQFEPNDEFDEAAPVEAGHFDGLVVGGGDQDYYAVELEEGEMLDVALGFSHADADVDVVVYGPDQRARGGSASVADDESVTVVADEAGTYYVEVYAVGGNSAEYEMELDVGEAPEGDRFEPNDDPESAVPLSDGTHENLGLFANDLDIFTVYLAEGQQVDVTATFDHEASDIDLIVVDESESLVGGTDSTDDDEHLSFEAPADGVYYLVVFSYQTQSAEYDLDVRVDGGLDREGWLERNDEFQFAAPLAFDSEVTGTADGSNDYYAVELAEGETTTVLLDANASGLELVPYGSDREYLTGADRNDDGSELTFTADADGVYYVVVTGDVEASYDLSVIEGTPDAGDESDGETEAADESTEEPDQPREDLIGDQTPGFGPAAAALALLVAALFAARRR